MENERIPVDYTVETIETEPKKTFVYLPGVRTYLNLNRVIFIRHNIEATTALVEMQGAANLYLEKDDWEILQANMGYIAYFPDDFKEG